VQTPVSNPEAGQLVQQISMCNQPAIKNKATSYTQPCTQRHIKDKHAPELVQIDGLVGGETARQGLKTGGAKNKELQRM